MDEISKRDTIFHIELVDGNAGDKSHQPKQSLTASLRQALRRLSTPEGVFGTEIHRFAREELESSSECTSAEQCWRVAEHLTNSGYRAFVKRAIGGGGCSSFDRLHHVFVETRLDVSGDGVCSIFIIEPAFRDAFTIQRPTPRYRQVLEELPDAFVGPKGRLLELVRILCKEMELAFATGGWALPPWRRYKSMASKWNPKLFREQTGPRTLGPAVGGRVLKMPSSGLRFSDGEGEAPPLQELSGFTPKGEKTKQTGGQKGRAGVSQRKPFWPDSDKIIVVNAGNSIQAVG